MDRNACPRTGPENYEKSGTASDRENGGRWIPSYKR